MTDELKRRLYEHKHPEAHSKAFTAKYNCYYLVYYEYHHDINQAIAREKQIKGWSRKKKEALITAFNPQWRFLNDEI